MDRKNISNFSYHIRNIDLVAPISFNLPPSGTVVILSVMISLWARRDIDLTYRSISSKPTDHHPMVKRPDEVINLLHPWPNSSDLQVGVWHGDAGLNQYRGRYGWNKGSPGRNPKNKPAVSWMARQAVRQPCGQVRRCSFWTKGRRFDTIVSISWLSADDLRRVFRCMENL